MHIWLKVFVSVLGHWYRVSGNVLADRT